MGSETIYILLFLSVGVAKEKALTYTILILVFAFILYVYSKRKDLYNRLKRTEDATDKLKDAVRESKAEREVIRDRLDNLEGNIDNKFKGFNKSIDGVAGRMEIMLKHYDQIEKRHKKEIASKNLPYKSLSKTHDIEIDLCQKENNIEDDKFYKFLHKCFMVYVEYARYLINVHVEYFNGNEIKSKLISSELESKEDKIYYFANKNFGDDFRDDFKAAHRKTYINARKDAITILLDTKKNDKEDRIINVCNQLLIKTVRNTIEVYQNHKNNGGEFNRLISKGKLHEAAIYLNRKAMGSDETVSLSCRVAEFDIACMKGLYKDDDEIKHRNKLRTDLIKMYGILKSRDKC